jgi:hypothetical protein
MECLGSGYPLRWTGAAGLSQLNNYVFIEPGEVGPTANLSVQIKSTNLSALPTCPSNWK